MSFLVVGTETVSVKATETPARERVYNRDENRAFDNTLLVTTTGTTKSEWRARTVPMVRADADTLVTQIETIPVTCSGDLLGGSVSCVGKVVAFDPVAVNGDHYVEVEFLLRQA